MILCTLFARLAVPLFVCTLPVVSQERGVQSVELFGKPREATGLHKESGAKKHSIAVRTRRAAGTGSGPDIILHNGNVITMDESLPRAEAIAIEGNRVSSVGTNLEILALQTLNTQVIDLLGLTVVPGLIEAHDHKLLHAFWAGGPDGLARATQEMAADGYTTVDELFGDSGFLEWARVLADQGRLAVRINAYLQYNSNCGDDHGPSSWMEYPYTTRKDTTLRIVGVKIFADGGSCGEPAISTLYQSGSGVGTHGDLFKTQEEMNAAVQEVLAAGYPIAMHAIGDSAVDVGLTAFENAFAGAGNTLRCRMEHLRVMREDLADRMASLGIAASIQYTWARASRAAVWEQSYAAEVLKWLFPWRRMANRGIPIVGGNDSPFASRTQAMQTISILATRKDQRDETLASWMDGDQLTVEEGIRAMTVTNAWAAFEEDVKGSITPGKLADLTVLSDDPLSVDPFNVRYITIEMTIMDGIIRHNKMGLNQTAAHDAGTISVGLDDQGLWGPLRSHVGLLYNGIEQLNQGSFIISYDPSTVASATAPRFHYATSRGGTVQFHEPGTVATEEATVAYEDGVDSHPGDLRITQTSFMWEGDPFLLVKYTVTNTGQDPLSDIYFGQLMDFRIGNRFSNMGGWESNQGLGLAFMHDASDPNSPYVGLTLLDTSGAVANPALTFLTDIYLMFESSVLSQSIRSGTIETATPSPGDYAIALGDGPFSLDPSKSRSPFMVAFMAGSSLLDLTSAANQAYSRLRELIRPGTWVPQASGTGNILWHVAAVSDLVAWVAASDGVVLRTVDGGQQWSNVGAQLSGLSVYDVEALDATTALVGARSSATSTAFIYRTSDGGTSWVNVFEQPGGFLAEITMLSPVEGVAIGDPVGGVWTILKTTDAGNTWNPIASPPIALEGEVGWNNGVTWVDPLTGWFGTNGPRAYRTTDAGASWSAVSIPLLSIVRTLGFNESGVGIASSTEGLARTVDGGTSWEEVSSEGSGSIRYMLSEGNVFWLLRGDTVYRSIDGGLTWDWQTSGGADIRHLSFAAVNQGVFGWAVGSNGTILRFAPETVTSVFSEGDGVPEHVVLWQNYPNPFNPSTTIRYELPTKKRVVLKIFSLLGEVVATLVNEEQQAGTHELRWDAGRFASGMYLYRMQTGDFIESKKLLLLK